MASSEAADDRAHPLPFSFHPKKDMHGSGCIYIVQFTLTRAMYSEKEGVDMHRRAPKFHPGLMTDMYHPDSAYVSWRTGHNGLTTFDLYTRTAPFGGAYLLVAGLEAALEFVQAFHYTPDELRFLAQIRDYDAAFLDELARLRFTGEILALPEGS